MTGQEQRQVCSGDTIGLRVVDFGTSIGLCYNSQVTNRAQPFMCDHHDPFLIPDFLREFGKLPDMVVEIVSDVSELDTQGIGG